MPDLLALFHVVSPGATEAAIASALTALGMPLPPSYLACIRLANGLEWCRNDESGDCLCLWSIDELQAQNAAYQVTHWLPGCLAIGSNGGGKAVLLDSTATPDAEGWPVVLVGFGNLDRDAFHVLAPSFQAWAEIGFRLRSQSPPQPPVLAPNAA